MKFRIGKADTQTTSGYLFVTEYSCPICPEKFKLFAPKDADQSAIDSAKEGVLGVLAEDCLSHHEHDVFDYVPARKK